MGFALEAGYELGGIVVCYVVIALLLLTLAVVQSVHAVLNVSVFGAHPFGGVANKLHNAVVRPLEHALHDVEALNAKFLSGLIDAFGMLIAIPLLLAFGVKALVQYLWHHALRPLIHSITDSVKTTAESALAKVNSLAGTVDTDISRARTYAETQAAGALTDAKRYADHWIDNAVKVLNGNIGDAIHTAERYADTAVGRLRSAEDNAIADAVGIANAAKTAGLNAARDALRTAEEEIGTAKNEAIAAAAGALRTAERYTDAAKNDAIAAAGSALVTAEKYADALKVIAEADAAAALTASETVGAQALETVKSVAVGVGNELKDLEGIYGALEVATLIASIPAIATLVHAIAEEAGLDKAECRGKVKGICGTDPSAWGNLLAGLAAVGFAFNLRQLYAVARPLVEELAPVIRKAA